MICKFCGKEFVSKNPSRKYCSDKCKNGEYVLRNRERRKEDIEFDKAWKAEHKPFRKSRNMIPKIKKEDTKARDAGMTYGKYQAMKYLKGEK